ncbi:MAG: xanthine/uracil/vitamin C permease, partial [Gemmatimonadetes bacterium]|nr:xanthine/uracil/vitamin C permease [Gemmatimonadota bacterium]
MSSPSNHAVGTVRYEPDEKPPWPLAAGLALQYTILALGGVVLTVAIVLRSAERSAEYLAWGAFGALLVCGIATIVQVRRFGRLGSGYVLIMGTSGAFIAVSVAALQQGGPALLASLVIVSSVFQFLLAGRLSLLRRVLTPTVAGTVIMLIAVNVMPFLFDFMDNVP